MVTHIECSYRAVSLNLPYDERHLVSDGDVTGTPKGAAARGPRFDPSAEKTGLVDAAVRSSLQSSDALWNDLHDERHLVSDGDVTGTPKGAAARGPRFDPSAEKTGPVDAAVRSSLQSSGALWNDLHDERHLVSDGDVTGTPKGAAARGPRFDPSAEKTGPVDAAVRSSLQSSGALWNDLHDERHLVSDGDVTGTPKGAAARGPRFDPSAEKTGPVDAAVRSSLQSSGALWNDLHDERHLVSDGDVTGTPKGAAARGPRFDPSAEKTGPVDAAVRSSLQSSGALWNDLHDERHLVSDGDVTGTPKGAAARGPRFDPSAEKTGLVDAAVRSSLQSSDALWNDLHDERHLVSDGDVTGTPKGAAARGPRFDPSAEKTGPVDAAVRSSLQSSGALWNDLHDERHLVSDGDVTGTPKGAAARGPRFDPSAEKTGLVDAAVRSSLQSSGALWNDLHDERHLVSDGDVTGTPKGAAARGPRFDPSAEKTGLVDAAVRSSLQSSGALWNDLHDERHLVSDGDVTGTPKGAAARGPRFDPSAEKTGLVDAAVRSSLQSSGALWNDLHDERHLVSDGDVTGTPKGAAARGPRFDPSAEKTGLVDAAVRSSLQSSGALWNDLHDERHLVSDGDVTGTPKGAAECDIFVSDVGSPKWWLCSVWTGLFANEIEVKKRKGCGFLWIGSVRQCRSCRSYLFYCSLGTTTVTTIDREICENLFN
eukprot:gene5918-4233_t